MPMLIPVIAMAAMAAAEVTILGMAVTWGMVGMAALTTALSLVSSLLTPSPSSSSASGSYQVEARDRKQVVRSAITSRKKIYGTVNCSGPMAYAGSSGDGNKYIHIVVPLAGHEVEEIGDVFFNDKLSTEFNAAYFRINKHLGTPTQAADPDLVAEVAEWTTAHRLQGIAYIYVRFLYSSDVFATGLPNVRATVKGAKIYDPRTATTYWTDNWALCMRDYLTDPVLGLGQDGIDIDEPAAIAAANISDELVNISSGTQKRYTCNGVVDTGANPASIIDQMRTAGCGFVLPLQGKLAIVAGAYTSPTQTLTANELRGPIKIRPRPSRKALFNGVRGLYVSPDNNWEMTDFPIVKNATYKEQDGGVEIITDVDLPFTNNGIAAQRIAKILLEKSRQGIVVEYPANWSALNLRVGETIYLDFDGAYGEPSLGWSNKVFRVESWALATDGSGVDLMLQEEAAANYAWNMGEATTVDPAPDTSLAPPVAPAIVAAAWDASVSGLAAAANAAGVTLSWNTANDKDQYGYEIRVGSSWEAGAVIVTNLKSSRFDWKPTLSGSLQFWLKAIVAGPSWSPYYSNQTASVGLGVNPPVVSALNQQVIDNNVLLTWTATPGSFSIDHAEIRRGTEFSSATVIGSFSGNFTAIFATASGTYKYWVVLVDANGLYGAEVGIYAVVNQPPDYILHDQRSLAMTGTKTNAVIDQGILIAPINAAETFQQHFDNHSWASPQAQVTAGSPYFIQPAAATGSYVETIDYGGTIPATKITLTITRATIAGTVIVTPTIESSLDGLSWTTYAGVYEAYATSFRYVRITLEFSTSDNGFLNITGSTVRLDVKQKSIQGSVSAVLTDSGGTPVDITGQFVDVQSIMLTAQGTTSSVAVYDFTDVPNPTSFKVFLFNQAGARISGTASYTVKGV